MSLVDAYSQISGRAHRQSTFSMDHLMPRMTCNTRSGTQGAAWETLNVRNFTVDWPWLHNSLKIGNVFSVRHTIADCTVPYRPVWNLKLFKGHRLTNYCAVARMCGHEATDSSCHAAMGTVDIFRNSRQSPDIPLSSCHLHGLSYFNHIFNGL